MTVRNNHVFLLIGAFKDVKECGSVSDCLNVVVLRAATVSSEHGNHHVTPKQEKMATSVKVLVRFILHVISIAPWNQFMCEFSAVKCSTTKTPPTGGDD